MRRASSWVACGLTAAMAVGMMFFSSARTRAQLQTIAQLPAEALRQIEAITAEKALRTPAQQKISSRLLDEQRRRRGMAVAGGDSLRRTIAVDAEGTVLVDIQTTVTDAVLSRIADVGGTVINVVRPYGAIRARLPLPRIDAVAELSDVQFIGPAERMMTQQRPDAASAPDYEAAKVDTSLGDIAHRAALARSLYGVTGAGVGIGVLADGVDTLADRQTSGDLPAVTVLPGQQGSGARGTAMLEIVHDLAPGASLLFATAGGGQAQFAANIQALCAAGAKVIVGDAFYADESVFQDGIVAQGVNAATASGCIYFSSVGNAGNKNDGTSGVWEGDFVVATNPPGVAGTAHSFGSANSTQVTADAPAQFTLQWSDLQGASTNDYDLYLFNPTLTQIYERSTDTQNGTQNPYESIPSTTFDDTNNRLVIVRFSGAARYLHLNSHRGRLAISTGGQAFGHAAANNTIAVAAVNVATAGGGMFSGGAANPVATYSSDGPRRIFYEPNGAAITPGNFSSTGGAIVQKPDIAAADCVATSTPGFSPFCGTAAAAPHAAAIAALMLEAVPSLTRAGVYAAISARAWDIEAAGVDRDSGFGIIDAIGALGRVHPAFVDSPLLVGSTFVKAVHVAQLRSRVDALRVRCGLSTFSFTDPVLTARGTVARSVHIAELRTALNAAYTACSVAPPAYTDPTIVAGSTVVRAAHIAELRAAIVALE